MNAPYPPQQQAYYPPPPQKKRRVWLWVLLGMLAAFVLMFAGCAALVGGTAASIDAAGKTVHRVTYQAETSGPLATVLYDTSTAGGTSNATATGVKSGWSIEVDHAGILGPSVMVSLDPTASMSQPTGTVTCRILQDGKVIKQASSSGQYANVSCNASTQELDAK